MKSPICTILLSKSEFSFALLLVTFEPFDLEQSYIPHLKALMCGINAAEAQGCECMFTFCHAYPKMGVLLHKMAIVCNLTLLAVSKYSRLSNKRDGWNKRVGGKFFGNLINVLVGISVLE